MKYLFDDISTIKQRIEKAGGAILLFDFDGVLSAIAETGKKAFISDQNLALLKQCADRFPTAIITGRTLKNIKEKVDLKNVFYIASHGLEWEENGQHRVKTIPKETIEAIRQAKEKLEPLLDLYPDMILEDKSFIVVANYRKMDPELAKTFIKDAASILEPIAKKHGLRLDHSMKDFELRPKINWDKGNSALFAGKHLNEKIGRKFIAIYVGDADTDEDAFKALERDGITIRVNSDENKHKESGALWYLENQTEVSRFLKWLLSLDLV